MMFRTLALAIAIGVVTAASAQIAEAKPLCIHSDGGVDLYFPKVKKPKAGRVLVLTGIETFFGAPVTGAAAINAAGTVSRVDVFVAALSAGGASVRYTWSGDATLAGVGILDTDGDNVSDGVRNFTIIDCSTLTLP